MPTIEQNEKMWNERHHWSGGGDEWSGCWGGTEQEWFGSIYPRIQKFLKDGMNVVEIAPGFGRWTQFLGSYANSYYGIDLAQKCVDACRKRFDGNKHMVFHKNDGTSLRVVPDGFADFIFSFDSLVHVDSNTLFSYLGEIYLKLAMGGVAFIHHSNMGEFVTRLPNNKTHWRDPHMTAGALERKCSVLGLRCLSQEKVNFGRNDHLLDCFSVIAREQDVGKRDNIVLENDTFSEEMARIKQWSKLYYRD